MSKYDSMTIEALTKESAKLAKDRAAIKAEQIKVAAVLGKKESEKKYADKVKAMNSAERKALAQAIDVVGIKSEEKVGEPGA